MAKGALFFIGGHEDKHGGKLVLEELARRVKPGKIVVTTVASHAAAGTFEKYERAFHNLGLRKITEMPISTREQARQPETLKLLDNATCVFFTGGDQLKITSQIGDTPIFRRVQEIYSEGGIIAGTSAGASVMCETMLVTGDDEQSAKIGELVRMAPGLGLISEVLVDQHFSERGRMGRLVGAVAQNPRSVGIGIDEDTAAIVEGGDQFIVLGNGAVYVLDGSTVTNSNIAEEAADRIVSIYDVRMHVLSQGDRFDFRTRRPGRLSRKRVEALPQEAQPAGADDQ
ncbi:MAG: cyanophycinase [Gemmataceae bacterium]